MPKPDKTNGLSALLALEKNIAIGRSWHRVESVTPLAYLIKIAPLLQVLVTASVAVFAAIIAYRQWKTAHQKVLIDLFERRLTVFDDAVVVISEVRGREKATLADHHKFSKLVDRAHFLFGNEVVQFLDNAAESLDQLRIDQERVAENELSGDQRVHAKHMFNACVIEDELGNL